MSQRRHVEETIVIDDLTGRASSCTATARWVDEQVRLGRIVINVTPPRTADPFSKISDKQPDP